MKKIFLLLAFCLLLYFVIGIWEPELAYMPAKEEVNNQYIQGYEGDGLGAEHVSRSTKITKELLGLGQESLYKETFGNEVFMSDVVGIVDGPINIVNISKAILQLKGQGTSNLKVELSEAIELGDKAYKKGEIVETGIDVAKGAVTPIGLTIKYAENRVKVGITCMACHAVYDPDTQKVVEGAPNTDLHAGLMMAAATNSAAYFTHTDIKNLKEYMKKGDQDLALPDARMLEKAVDATLMKWPRGSFDTTIDLHSNPTQIPDSFTRADFPYGWSGHAVAGPFHGLNVFSNNVHAQNTDATVQSEVSDVLFGINKEIYLGTLLQNAANPHYRFSKKSGLKPSEFMRSIDKTPDVPGFNEVIKPPTYPKFTVIAPDGLYISSPGFKVGEQVNSMSAYQNTMLPPKEERLSYAKEGELVFRRANCNSCHAGKAYTNHQVIAVEQIKTEPSRAKAFANTERFFDTAYLFTKDQRVPLPEHPKVEKIPTGHLDRGQLKLAFGWGNTNGGYKVKGLVGLRWTAPYLHDGGVAVGPKLSQLGVPGTLSSGISPDPANSLKALVDKNLRQLVIKANNQEQDLKDVHVTGEGHEFWVDETTGFTEEEQKALVHYLLSLELNEEMD